MKEFISDFLMILYKINHHINLHIFKTVFGNQKNVVVSGSFIYISINLWNCLNFQSSEAN